MTPALQSYTPTPRPLNYDALEGAEGCGTEIGEDFFGTLAFNQMCVFPHSMFAFQFSQPDSVSYAFGPALPGSPLRPFDTLWSAWLSTAGVRISKLGLIVPPSPEKGSPSGIFPSVTDASKLTHCFDANGLMHMAVWRKATAYIELRWYTDTVGTHTGLMISGSSPMLFYTGAVEGSAGVVLYYLREERPFVLFARFSNEGFEVEHEVLSAMRANLTRLISMVALGTEIRLYASDSLNHDITLYSPDYARQVFEKTLVGIGFDHGIMAHLVSRSLSVGDKAMVGVIFARSFMKLGEVATAAPAPSKIDKASVGTMFDSGEMNPS